MVEKSEYVIESTPVRVSVVCPHCDEIQVYDFDVFDRKFGAEVYYGDCGSVECLGCQKEFELGSCTYD
ncbi:hypothetical protein GIX45_28420 [Erwinia sp. CPCC 100877]|nr:hypothetical protein [Erwinia sp. CPCC 100877]